MAQDYRSICYAQEGDIFAKTKEGWKAISPLDVLNDAGLLPATFTDHVDGYVLLATDKAVRVTGAGNAAVSLPVTGLSTGQLMLVSQKLTNSSNLTVNTVDGAAIGNSGNDTSEVLWQYGNVRGFRWDGSMWWVVSR